MHMFYVYILVQNDKHLYTGFTDDLRRRYKQHTNGLNISTKHKRPLVLIHYEAYLLKTDATRRERFLKTTEGKRLLKQQVRDILIKHDIIK